MENTKINSIGWIKLHRCIMENKFYFKERFTPIMAWIDLLLLAGHKPTIIIIRGMALKLTPGELCWSQRNLAKRWKWNPKTVSGFLKTLHLLEMVDYKNAGFTTIINIRNWAKYQDNRKLSEDGADNKTDRYTDFLTDHSTGTNKKERNLKKLYVHNVLKNLSSENKDKTNGKDKNFDPYSVKARLAYRPDPARAKQRLEEIRKLLEDKSELFKPYPKE